MVISDSPTLILLAKCGLIELFLSDFSLIIPKTVYDEAIRKGAEMGRYDAYLLEKLVQDGKIQVMQSNRGSLKEVQDFFSLHCGESDAIALCKDLKAAYLLCDDKKAVNACRILGSQVCDGFEYIVGNAHRWSHI